MWGIVPAAGKGSRIQPLAFSKELLPVGSRLDGETERPCAVSEYLVERMMRGGADKICFVISPGKSDILEYYGGGYGAAADRLRRAAARRRAVRRDVPRRCRWSRRTSRCIVGLPDTIWFPEDALAALPDDELSFLLFPVDRPEFFDAVVIDEDGGVLEIQVKQRAARRRNWIWGAFKMPGGVLARAARALAGARRARRVYRHAGQRLARRRAGARVGVRAGERLCRRRHARRLPRGDRACSARPTRSATPGAADSARRGARGIAPARHA